LIRGILHWYSNNTPMNTDGYTVTLILHTEEK